MKHGNESPAERACSPVFLPRWLSLDRDTRPPAPKGEIHLWSFGLEEGADDREAASSLHPLERRRAAEFATPVLAARFIRARAGLRRILGAYLGVSPRRVSLIASDRGKPGLAGGELRFNLSHTDVRAIVAVCAERSIGVDVEEARPTPDASLIAERWFFPGEREWLQRQRDQHRAFLRCWVRREAVLKAVGMGLTASPGLVDLAPPPRFALARVMGREAWVHELPLGRDCVGAVALCSKEEIREAALFPRPGRDLAGGRVLSRSLQRSGGRSDAHGPRHHAPGTPPAGRK